MTTLINIAVPVVILDAEVDVDEYPAFALPARTVVISWQTDFDVNPATISLAIQVAIELDGPYTNLDTSTTVTPALRTITTPVAARFIRAVIVDNDDEAEVTIELLCKVANP